MMPIPPESQAPIPPPAYHRAQASSKDALHINALTLVRCLHLLAICRLAVSLAHRLCSPPLPAGSGAAPRSYACCGDSPIMTCLSGSKPGPLCPWPVGYLLIERDARAFPAPPNSANAFVPQELPFLKVSSC